MEETERKPIFSNTYVPEEETDRQLFRSIRFVRRLFLFLVGAGFLCYFVYWLIRLIQWTSYGRVPIYTQSLFWICIAGFTLYVFLIVREIFAPRTFAKRQRKRLTETYGTDRITIDAAFFDDSVAFHNRASNAEMHLQYSSLKLLTETKDLFILRTQQKQIIALSKLGFDGTDIVGFRAFIDEKCPNAKRKWKKAE